MIKAVTKRTVIFHNTYGSLSSLAWAAQYLPTAIPLRPVFVHATKLWPYYALLPLLLPADFPHELPLAWLVDRVYTALAPSRKPRAGAVGSDGAARGAAAETFGGELLPARDAE